MVWQEKKAYELLIRERVLVSRKVDRHQKRADSGPSLAASGLVLLEFLEDLLRRWVGLCQHESREEPVDLL
jgi:hypothetical protein